MKNLATKPITPADLWDLVQQNVGASFSVTDLHQTLDCKAFLGKVSESIQKLRSLGVSAGDRVVVASQRGLDFWIDCLAVWAVDGVLVPVNSPQNDPHREYILQLVSPKIAYGEPWGAKANPAIEEILRRRTSGPIGAIIFTSGSTGRPKGVLLTARSLFKNAMATRERLGLGPEHRLLIPISCHFVSGISHLLVTSISGASLVIHENIQFPKAMLETIEKFHVNAIGGAPIHLRWVSDFPADTPIRWAMSSGDRLGGDLAQKLIERFPHLELRAVYGLTELGGRFCVADNQQIRGRWATVGSPIDGLEIKISSDDGHVGDVIVSGNTLMDGYVENFLNDPSYRPITSFNTGDVGALYNGLLELSGRSDDVFKVSGLKVSAHEVAEVLMSTGVFKDIYVTQFDYAGVGTVVAAYYAPKDREVKLVEVLPELRKHLATHAVPRILKKVSEIPRTGSGKINRQRMREILKNEGLSE